ncbi:hypothetical protein SLE2022_197260 [Rubroshorea leprosula]
MLIVQVSSFSFDDVQITSELKRLAHAFRVGATANNPILPLTALVVQDHQGISNVAPADAPLHLLPIPGADSGPEPVTIGNAVEARIHDYTSDLQFSISPTAFFRLTPFLLRNYIHLLGIGLD